MKQITYLAMIAILATTALAITPFNPGWQRQIGRPGIELCQYTLPATEYREEIVYPMGSGYIWKDGKCYPFGRSHSDKTEETTTTIQEKPETEPEPTCHTETNCEWTKKWKCLGHGHHKFCYWNWKYECNEEEVCEPV